MLVRLGGLKICMAAYTADPADDPAEVIEFQPQNTASKGRPKRISTVNTLQ